MNIYIKNGTQSFRGWHRTVSAFLLVTLLLLQVVPAAAQSEANDLPAESEEPLVLPQAATDVTPDVFYYHQDMNGNLVAMTDAAGQVVWRANSQPFGQGTPTSEEHQLHFVEQPQEPDIGDLGGLYHLGARYYDPITGRFISPDPLSVTNVAAGNSQLFNRYAYALNNPYRYEDPSGMAPGEASGGPSPHATYKILKEIADNPKIRPDIRLGAQKYVEMLDEAFGVLKMSPENVTQAQVAKAIATIADSRSLAAMKGTNRAGFIKFLDDIGKFLSKTGAGNWKSLKKGGPILSIIFGLIALPSIVEAAEQDKYGTATAEVLDLIIPSLTPTPTTFYFDPKTQEVVQIEGGIIFPLGRTVDDIIYWVKQE